MGGMKGMDVGQWEGVVLLISNNYKDFFFRRLIFGIFGLKWQMEIKSS